MSHIAKEKLINFLTLINEPFIIEGEARKTPFGWGIGIHYGKETKNE